MPNNVSITATGCSDITHATTTDSHSSQIATATIDCLSSTLNLGDFIELKMGYVGNLQTVFTGYVKIIEKKEPPLTLSITASNVLVRAMDFFIASANPDTPFSRKNIKAEDLVGELMGLAGISSYIGENTSFTFGINNPVEVNLTSSYDYSRFIADILAYSLYADIGGTVHFARRFPYPVGGDTSIGTITTSEAISMNYSESEKDLRNRVVVYGAEGIHAEATASSPYLPPGFKKTVVVAAPTVFDNQEMAQQSADYNLDLLNRLTKNVNISMIGNPAYHARSSCTVVNSSLGLSGLWYIFSATHTADSAGYLTSLDVRK